MHILLRMTILYISSIQIEIFSKVKDMRDLGKVKHELEDVLRMTLICVLCDCEDCDDISDMVKDREEEFKAAGLLKLSNGVLCSYTILRVVESVNSTQLLASLDCCRGHIIESLCGNQVIIDGKKSKESGMPRTIYPQCVCI